MKLSAKKLMLLAAMGLISNKIFAEEIITPESDTPIIETNTPPKPEPLSVLVFSPYPDDDIIGCGGSICKAC